MYFEIYEIKLIKKTFNFNLIKINLQRISTKDIYELDFKFFYNLENEDDILFELFDQNFNIINKKEFIKMINIYKRKNPRILRYTNKDIESKLNRDYSI